MPKAVLFDLDGTLTDSGPGIIDCAIRTFSHYGIAIPSYEELRTIVGPPLHDSLHQFGIPEKDIDDATMIFRGFYKTVGKYNNTPYPGIKQLLSRLKENGCSLYVATSKPEDMAIDIMEHFELAPYFEKICGAVSDVNNNTKEYVISQVLSQIDPSSDIIMVGDTVFDVEGAAAHHLPAIGVSWGYGDVAQMEQTGAVSIAHTMDELFQQIMK